ncbi:MAG: hypothetical protein OHK0048_20430 [Rhodoferax sp.]
MKPKHPNRRQGLVLSLAAATLSLISGCAPLVMGGAMIGGAMVATDRRTSGAQLEDEGIELHSASRISERWGDKVHINVTSYNRRVLLTGEAPDASTREQIERLVSAVDNVQLIVNEIAVLGNSTLAQRSSDAVVTGRVKAGLVDAKDLSANAFKVVTERGVTYLMGRVTQREADRATEVARSTQGVQKVVRVFEFISEAELSKLTAPPASASAPGPKP